MTNRMNLKMEARDKDAAFRSTFSLSCWEWAPLYALLAGHCSSLIGEDLLQQLADFDEKGPELKNSCDQIAGLLEFAIHTVEPANNGKDHIDIFAVGSQDLRVNQQGNQLAPAELADSEKFRKSVTPYQISRERIEEFIEFLRQCGGFKVS